MTMIAKRSWSPGLSVDEEVQILIQWLDKARQKNVLANRTPTLYEAYVCDNLESVSFMHDVSSLFKWSSKDTTDTDAARDSVLRLLCVAIKAKYFVARNDKSRHEPYFFVVPDISNPEKNRYGVVLRLNESKKSIVVSESDIAMTSSKKVLSGRFPVVLGTKSFSWVNTKHWKELYERGDVARKVARPWEMKKEKERIDAWTSASDFPFGEVFDVPFHLKEEAKAAGMLWAQGIRKWYLPHGFDISPVVEYMKYLTETVPAPASQERETPVKKNESQPERKPVKAIALHELEN